MTLMALDVGVVAVYGDFETAPVFSRVMTAKLDTDFEIPQELWDRYREARERLILVEQEVHNVGVGGLDD